MKAPTKRFSNRVENYVKYRPSYPIEVLSTLKPTCGLDANSVVADIGSGTGILSGLLLKCGYKVYAVEPNKEMRQAADKAFNSNDIYHSIDGSAECTKLKDKSVDIITAAQAFHWFKMTEAKHEFSRILKKDGWVALIWNERKTDSPFLQAYDKLLCDHAPEYSKVNHRNIHRKDIDQFFGPSGYRLNSFANEQHFDLDGLIGRLLSSSYCPSPNQSGYKPLMAGLKAVFDKSAVNEIVSFTYDTKVYYGKMT